MNERIDTALSLLGRVRHDLANLAQALDSTRLAAMTVDLDAVATTVESLRPVSTEDLEFPDGWDLTEEEKRMESAGCGHLRCGLVGTCPGCGGGR